MIDRETLYNKNNINFIDGNFMKFTYILYLFIPCTLFTFAFEHYHVRNFTVSVNTDYINHKN